MKTKYDWSRVPDEVQWIATDKDGWMSMHSSKPTIDGEDWLDDEEGFLFCDHYKLNKFKGDWKDSLEERPQ